MAGKGLWTIQEVYRNCGACRQCKEDPKARPHGPYYQLRRRNPENYNQQDTVYLGKQELSEGQLLIINNKFTGSEVPQRYDVLSLVA